MQRILFNVAIEGDMGGVIVQQAGRKSGEKFVEKDTYELPVCWECSCILKDRSKLMRKTCVII